MTISIVLSTDENRQSCPAQIRLTPLPTAKPETVAALFDDAAELFHEICFYWEPSHAYAHLPAQLQREIDQGLWFGAIAQLKVRELVQVEIGGGS